MFSKQIVQTDAFIDMPASSQLLYFHLAMDGDDDGFVSSPKKIMRMLGSSDDDYKILAAKRFIIPFENGICVIKHWLIHNYIRQDTYTETKYVEQKNLLELKDNGAYTDRPRAVHEPSTQYSISKSSIDKIREEKSIYGEFKNVKLFKEEYHKLVTNIGEKNTNIIIEELSSYIASKGKKYSSHYATLLNWARRKFAEHKQQVVKNYKGKQVE